jgi:ankyrin repeat protein
MAKTPHVPTREDIVDDFVTAAWQNETDLIDSLAAQNPWLIDPAQPYLQQALLTACGSCQQNSAQQLVEKYHADVNKMSEIGMNALHESMSAADMVTAKMLIRNGADVNTPTQTNDGFVDGWTPLHFAISHRDTEMMLYLLKVGADARAKDKDGLDAPAFARRDRREDLATIIERAAPTMAADAPAAAAPKRPSGPKAP